MGRDTMTALLDIMSYVYNEGCDVHPTPWVAVYAAPATPGAPIIRLAELNMN